MSFSSGHHKNRLELCLQESQGQSLLDPTFCTFKIKAKTIIISFLIKTFLIFS